MPTQNKDKAEKGGTAAKLKKKKTNIQRSHTFGSSYENPATKKKDSPTLKEKKNTPTSSPFPEPKYTKAVYLLLEAKKLAREIEEKKKNGDLFRNKLRGSGRGQTFSRPGTPNFVEAPGNSLKAAKGKALQDVSRRCEECGRGLEAGRFSQHLGQAYCNVPCYSMLFSSLKSLLKQDEGEDVTDGLSTEQQRFRNTLIPKLRTYNTYYADKPFQISCKECRGELVLEGTLKIYWGLKKPVVLKASDTSYWRGFQPDDSVDGADKKNSIPRPKSAMQRRNTDSKPDTSFRAPTVSSYMKQANNNEEVVCYRGANYRKQEKTTFVPPHGVPTMLRITNNMKTIDVITMLLRKFQITNKPSQYTLCTVYESGGVKSLRSDTTPLLQRLYLGPCEDVSKIYIMERADHQDIPHEIAQYSNFAMYELENFLQKFKEEEEREVIKLKERFEEYKEHLQKRMKDLTRTAKVTRL